MILEQILTDINLEGEEKVWGLYDNGERKLISQEEKRQFLNKYMKKKPKKRKPY